jgi:hypothetical protein
VAVIEPALAVHVTPRPSLATFALSCTLVPAMTLDWAPPIATLGSRPLAWPEEGPAKGLAEERLVRIGATVRAELTNAAVVTCVVPVFEPMAWNPTGPWL